MTTLDTYLVTGANGFIGGWLAETLYLRGTRVRAGAHNWSGAARVARFPIEIVPCDILDAEQVTLALNGVTHVIHCAKGSHESIVTGTQNMLEASLRRGVERSHIPQHGGGIW